MIPYYFILPALFLVNPDKKGKKLLFVIFAVYLAFDLLALLNLDMKFYAVSACLILFAEILLIYACKINNNLLYGLKILISLSMLSHLFIVIEYYIFRSTFFAYNTRDIASVLNLCELFLVIFYINFNGFSFKKIKSLFNKRANKGVKIGMAHKDIREH